MSHLSYNLSEIYQSIDQSNLELRDLEYLISWKKAPTFLRTGRSAFKSLEKPIPVAGADIKVNSIKLKGLGARTHLGDIIKPTTLAVHNTNPHLGFDEKGAFIPLKSSLAPVGGITLERARKEFFIGKILNENNCPCVVPMRVYEYLDKGMKFITDDGTLSNMGAVIMGLPNATHLRVNDVFNYRLLDDIEKEEIQRWLTGLKIVDSENPILRLIAELSNLYGQTIRKFSEAGFYRYSGAPDNYSYSVSTGKVFLIDLDSSLFLKNISAIERPLQIMRDVASGIAYLIAFLTNPNSLKSFPAEEVVLYNPFQALLEGYYHDVSKDLITNLIPIILDYYKDVFVGASKQQNQGYVRQYDDAAKDFQSFLSQSFLRPWIDRKEVFSCVIAVVWVLHNKSGMLEYAPCQITAEHLFGNISQYCSNQMADWLRVRLNRYY